MRGILCAALSSVAVLVVAASASAAAPSGINDGLNEVNLKRAQRGLPPFIRDDGLTQAAAGCAEFRARMRLFGHTSNDFGFLPPGARADSAGCAAYPASYGWMSCCTYDRYTYAGAAYAMGMDGKRYMHLFVSSSRSPLTFTAAPAAGCADGHCVLPPPVVSSPPPVFVVPPPVATTQQYSYQSTVKESYSFKSAASCANAQSRRMFFRERVTLRERLRFRSR